MVPPGPYFPSKVPFLGNSSFGLSPAPSKFGSGESGQGLACGLLKPGVPHPRQASGPSHHSVSTEEPPLGGSLAPPTLCARAGPRCGWGLLTSQTLAQV